MERLTSGCEWRHAPEARQEDLGDFEKSQLSWVPGSEVEFLAHRSQASGLVAGATRVGGGVQMEKPE